MVECIKRLPPELERALLGFERMELLEKRQIPVVESGGAELIAGAVVPVISTPRGTLEYGGVEPLINGSRSPWQVRIARLFRATGHAASREIETVGGPQCHGLRGAISEERIARNLPIVQQYLRHGSW